jgi:hypothetical protein
MRMLATKSFIWASSSLALLLFAGRAGADEPKKVGEPRVLSEPGELTDVVDAFDGDDVFDMHLSIGYQYTSRHANIRRETNLGDAQNRGLSTGGYLPSNMNVASYEETTSRLNTRLDVGIYHDIALFFRMPIILADNRKLEDLSGSSAQQAVTLAGVPGEGPLFSIPFKSPQRSGIDYFAVGADFGFMNQYRDAGKPTWVFGIEGRFSVGEPMHACNASLADNQVSCAYPSDINRNGVSDGVTNSIPGLEGNFNPGGRKPGVSRGTNGLELHSYISKRIKYIEPYAGFRALFEFQQGRSDYGMSDLKGSLVNHPPFEGWGIFGMQVIPWEQRESYQRITFDTRFAMSYRTEGRDYSPLFDALGSSNAPGLRNPNYSGYMATPSGSASPSQVNLDSQKVYFSGLTDVQQFATFSGSVSVTWQAAEYVKFQAGGGYLREQSHSITTDQPCNPDFKNSVGAAGPCVAVSQNTYSATGIPNPNYRAGINTVGHRFRSDDGSVWNAWLNAVVMF